MAIPWVGNNLAVGRGIPSKRPKTRPGIGGPMFEKREVRAFPNLRREEAWNKAWDWWSRQGFKLTQTGPYRFHGSSFYSRIGLRREFDLVIDEGPGGSRPDPSFPPPTTGRG